MLFIRYTLTAFFVILYLFLVLLGHFLGAPQDEQIAFLIGYPIVAIPIWLILWHVTRPPLAQLKKFSHATLAIGTIISARATGNSINDQPQVEFTIEVTTNDGHTFRAMTREYVNLAAVTELRAGEAVPVRYLPNEQIALTPDTPASSIEELLYRDRIRQGKMTEHDVRLANSGLRADAVVMSTTPTGKILGDQAIMRLELRVTRPDGSQFDATRELPLPAAALPGLQPGSVVEVSYSPENESFVGISARTR